MIGHDQKAMVYIEASWNGATLAERLAHVRRHRGGAAPIRGDLEPSSASRDDPLAQWARACAFGDRDALLRRLSWDGIDADVARAAMAVDAPGDFPVAAWVSRLADLVAAASACAPAAGTHEWVGEFGGDGRESPFVDAWVPVLRAAGRRLALNVPACRDWLSDESIRALEGHLLHELSRLGELVLLEDFRTQTRTLTAGDTNSGSSEGYWSYIRNLLASRYGEVLGAFPVLARQAAMLADQWVDQIAALVSRLKEDRAVIESTFGSAPGSVRRVTPGLSDRHAGGCRVALVEFASGLRLAYKPRGVRLERVFNELAAVAAPIGLDRGAVPASRDRPRHPRVGRVG